MNRTGTLSEGCKRLRAWMARGKYANQVEAARVIGVPYYHFNKIYLGLRLPGRDLAVQIERETGIPVDAWASTRHGNARTSQAASGRNA